MQVKRRKGWRMSCHVGEVTEERLENELCSFRRFTYITAHSPTLLLLHLRHSSFSNSSFASLTSQVLHLIHLASRPSPSQNKFFLIKDFEKNHIFFSSHSKQDYIETNFFKYFFLSSQLVDGDVEETRGAVRERSQVQLMVQMFLLTHTQAGHLLQVTVQIQVRWLTPAVNSSKRLSTKDIRNNNILWSFYFLLRLSSANINLFNVLVLCKEGQKARRFITG